MTLLLPAVLAGCGSSATSGGKHGSRAAAGLSWADYFPPRVGRSCLFQRTDDSLGTSITIRQTSTFTKVVHAADRTQATLRVLTQTDGNYPSSSQVDVPYVFAGDGTLRTTPGKVLLGSKVQTTFDGLEVYPSVADLRRGRSRRSTLTLRAGSSDPAAAREIGGGFTQRLTLDAGPADAVPSVVTPAGTFTDLVGVHVAFVDVSVQGGHLSPGETNAIRSLTTAAFDTSVYFARGVGIVTSTTTRNAAPPLVSCTG